MILRDENGVDWECAEVGAGSRGRTSYRLLQCQRMDNPKAAPREIAVPAGLDLEDPYIQRLVLSTPYTRDD